MTQWHENRQKSLEKNYKAGKVDGIWSTWDVTGQKLEEGEYNNGLEDGRWIFWYPNGQKKREGDFEYGKLLTIQCWDELGLECECGFVGCK